MGKGGISMKRKILASSLALCLSIALLWWIGIGPYSSGSAVEDLKAELSAIYGAEYTGKSVENGTEDMVFVVVPKTWLCTNWNLRNALRMDYQYECKVIVTTYTGGGTQQVRTITYQAYDPMGTENMAKRAYIDLDSKIENTGNGTV